MVSPELLRRYPFFAGLTHQQLTSLATVAHTMSFEAGETVFRDGEPATYLYLVVDGQVHLFVESDYQGHRVNITDADEREVLGWPALVAPHEYTATAECSRQSELVSFDARELRQIIEADSQVGCVIMRGLCNVLVSRLRSAYVELASLVPVPA